VSVAHAPYQDLELGDPITTANVPGLGFIWGGTNYGDSLLECTPSANSTNFGCGIGYSFDAVAPAQMTVVMDANRAGANWLNLVLDTRTLPFANHIHPSYGRIGILSIVPVP